MKKIFLIIVLFLNLSAMAEPLKAGITEEYIPNGFFGSWGVISKLVSSTNPVMFNFESRDIWMLLGVGNILILENLESGARSEITITKKAHDNKTLSFERIKTVTEKGNKKTIYKEAIDFILNGNNFSGTDIYSVEKYENNKQIKKDSAKYKILGVKIAGNSFPD